MTLPDDDAPSKNRLRLWLKLLKTSRAIEGRIRERLREDHATTLPRFDVLAALYQHEAGLRMSEISGALKVSNGNVTGIVDRLVKDGHVEPSPDERDRRATKVRLTRAGRDYFERLAAEHEGWIDGLLVTLGTEDVRQLSAFMDRIAADQEERK